MSEMEKVLPDFTFKTGRHVEGHCAVERTENFSRVNVVLSYFGATYTVYHLFEETIDFFRSNLWAAVKLLVKNDPDLGIGDEGHQSTLVAMVICWTEYAMGLVKLIDAKNERISYLESRVMEQREEIQKIKKDRH